MSTSYLVETDRDGVHGVLGFHTAEGFITAHLTKKAALAIAAALDSVYGDGEFYIHEEQSK